MSYKNKRLSSAKAIALALVLMITGLRPAGATILPDGFAEVPLVTPNSLDAPMAMAFAPDGRLFVCERVGNLRIVKNGALLATPFLRVNPEVTSEHGLIGLAIDPNFAINGWVYINYTVPGPPYTRIRISRFTASGDTAIPGSEVILFEGDDLSNATMHHGGQLNFGADGKLYISTGELFVAANAQTLSNTLGKLLRINSDGSIPTDNPFYASTTGKNRAIWALGLRNPFSFAVQPGTGKIYVNDVGYSNWEEIDEARAGGNYGWPNTEGMGADARYINPVYTYPHGVATFKGNAITGGAFYNPTSSQFPAQYVGKYFFLDHANEWIHVLDPATKAVSEFAVNIAESPIHLAVSPTGSMFYISHFGGAIYEIKYTGVLSPQIGEQPLNQLTSVGYSATFKVTASGSQPLTYQWEKDGAAIDGATAAVYTLDSATIDDNGAQFRCQVSNSNGSALSDSATLTVTTDQPPTATITTPVEGTLYSAGETINFAGTGSDPENGGLIHTWAIDLGHHEHFHPFMMPANFPANDGVSGGSFSVPRTGETSDDVYYRLYFKTTDPVGLSSTVIRDIFPRKSTFTLDTNPPGLQLRLDGSPVAPPLATLGVVGVTRTIEADSPQTLDGKTYEFVSWSDDGAATHNISTPVSDTIFTANFREIVPFNDASFVSQSVPTSMVAGQRQTILLTMRNTGSTTWTPEGKYRLGVINPPDNSTWALKRVEVPYPVEPGASVTFSFVVGAPLAGGNYHFQWRMVQDGVQWFGAPTNDVVVAVTVAGDAAAYYSQQVPATMVVGQTYKVSVTMQNVGTNAWPTGTTYRLGSQYPQDNFNWGTNRVALPMAVAPGGKGTFTFTIAAPATPGQYNFQWKMIHGGWFGDQSINRVIDVVPPPNAATFVRQTVPSSMVAGARQAVSVTMKNTGTATWTPGAFRLGSENPRDNTRWGLSRVYLSAPVAPGSEATFDFTAAAPKTPGSYNFQWRMLQSGVAWFGNPSQNAVVSVSGTPPNAASFVGQSVPLVMTANTTYDVSITMQNTGTATWTAAAKYRLGSQSPRDNVVWGGNRVFLPATVSSVPPGSQVTFTFRVGAPATPGNYDFQWQMLQEGAGWFEAPSPKTTIAVQ